MASGRHHRVPIFRDDRSLEDRHGSAGLFDDLWGSDSFSSRSRLSSRDPFSSRVGGLSLGDEVDRLCQDFFQLKPRNPRVGNIRVEDRGSRESLEDEKVFRESPQGTGRLFQMSFDVRDYEPHHLSIKVDRDTLVVEAKRDIDKDGMKSTKQFSRSIHIPKEVDPDKLTSSLSHSGILTIEAPVPPEYKSLSYETPQTKYSSSSDQTRSYIPVQGISSSYQPHSLYSQETQRGQAGQIPIAYCHGQPSYQSTVTTSMTGTPAMSQLPPNSQQPYAPYPQSPPAYPQTQPAYPQQPPAYPQSPPAYPQSPPPQPNYPAPPPPSTASKKTPPPESEPAKSTSGIPLETPVFSDSGDGRRMDLIVELGKPYTPEDILVKLEGKQLQVEAEHVEKIGGKKSKSCISREFDLDEDVDPRSVQANFDDDGRLIISATVVPKSESEEKKEEIVTEL